MHPSNVVFGVKRLATHAVNLHDPMRLKENVVEKLPAVWYPIHPWNIPCLHKLIFEQNQMVKSYKSATRRNVRTKYVFKVV